MLPYWFLFLIPACLAATPPRLTPSPHVSAPLLWRVMFVVLVLMIGLRHEVGGDWFMYLGHIDLAGGQDFREAIETGDPSYSVLNWLAAKGEWGPYFVNTVCALLFTWGLMVFCSAQPRPWLAMVVAVPYLVVVVAMGYTRQGVAIGFAMLALAALSQQQLVKFIVCVVLAATFHKSAVILMPLAILATSKKRIWTALWVGVCSLLFYAFLLQDSVGAYNKNYLETEYESSGAAIRILMNVVPALLFLMFRQRFVKSTVEGKFWTWMSIGALTLAGLLYVSPSSTAVDRIALYWIPLQLFVFSRLPNALGNPSGRNDLWVCIVVLYSASVLFVWLTFAKYASVWLPYQFYPWVVMWR